MQLYNGFSKWRIQNIKISKLSSLRTHELTKQIMIIATHIITNFLCFSFQSLESELVCSTAYLELFIRKITEPRLLAVFLQFLFTESHDGKVIIDILVTRLALQSQVRIIKK